MDDLFRVYSSILYPVVFPIFVDANCDVIFLHRCFIVYCAPDCYDELLYLKTGADFVNLFFIGLKIIL